MPYEMKICTADNPAPPGNRKYAYAQQWSFGWQHNDAVGTCINDDYDDWRYDCPHCKCVMIYEGSDA